MRTVDEKVMIWRVPIARIEQVVSGHLGPGRLPGNAASPCLPKIGRFYNAATTRQFFTPSRKLKGSERPMNQSMRLLTVSKGTFLRYVSDSGQMCRIEMLRTCSL
jgi:hypothetical protein